MKRDLLHDHHPVETDSEEAATIASMLAPLEEQDKQGSGVVHHQRPNGGSILLDTAELKLPKNFMDEDKERGFHGLEPIVIFILLLVLAFIGFVAYLISVEPS